MVGTICIGLQMISQNKKLHVYVALFVDKTLISAMDRKEVLHSQKQSTQSHVDKVVMSAVQ